MMSLTKIRLGELVKKQYTFKLRAYSGIFTTLMVLQAIAIFFSIIGSNSSGTWSSHIGVTANYYSADQVIVFTMLWIFISSILITTQAYREDDFTFVSNRVSNNLANALILMTASIIGALTSYLSGFFIKVIVRYLGVILLPTTGLPSTVRELISGIVAIILIMILISAIGYLVGVIVQINKIFMVVLPALFIGFLFIANNVGDSNVAISIFNFYFNESSIIFFTIKVFITSTLLLIASFGISNRQEVRL